MSALELLDVSIRPCESPAPLFAPLTLRVPAGSVTTIIGPSGIGKSTLIDFIGGHLSAGFEATGRVLLNGRDVTRLPAEARRIGILFQDALLFPHLSVGDNLAFGLARDLRGRSKRRAAVEAALDQAGLSGFYDRDPATLSGGQRARAALMRTLLAEPRALLLDEPFSKLDPDRRAEIRAFVFDHIRERGVPVLMVSHDVEDAEAASGPLVALE
ncbi:ATP-binding cassette domain-containing protein [Defluviimonas sp. SAOS-178_SWC]|uniref:ATP-binding cassette domain-containing protein n=1 Tax=Defluviimonas sp. SAOS-178_SWC TaxID=3121287 RepID=UPI00322192A2